MKIKKYFILIINILIVNFLIAQESFFSNDFNKISYFSNKAELYICQNNFKEASVYYDSVFSFDSKPFSRDVFNRALCEKMLGNQVLADSMFKCLYLDGFSMPLLGKCFDTANLYQLKKKNEAKEIQLFEIIKDIIKTDQSTNSRRYSDMEKYLNTVLKNAERIMKLTNEAESDTSSLFTLENSELYFQILHFFQL